VANSVRVNGNVTVGNVFSTNGLITAAFFVGNGSQIFGIPASGTQFIDVVGNVTASANVDAANMSTTWLIVNGNANIAGQVNVEGNVVGGFLIGNGARLTGVTSTGMASPNPASSMPKAISIDPWSGSIRSALRDKNKSKQISPTEYTATPISPPALFFLSFSV
jgi:hypothetical protein